MKLTFSLQNLYLVAAFGLLTGNMFASFVPEIGIVVNLMGIVLASIAIGITLYGAK